MAPYAAGAALLSLVLAIAWWIGAPQRLEPVGGGTAAAARGEVVLAAHSARPATPPEWGTSPFSDGAPVVGPESSPEVALSPFEVRVRHFHTLRTRLDSLPTPTPELLALARALRDEVPRLLRRHELSPGQALMLTGSLLEVLQPDTQLRAAEIAYFSARYLPRAAPPDGSS